VDQETYTARGRVLVRACVEDVPGIVALETAPEMAWYIGNWSAERHLKQIQDPAWWYLVTHDECGAVDGLAIVAQYSPRFRWYELARFVIARPGEGRGTDLLVPVIDQIFDRLNAHRIQLDAYTDNERAIRAYERVGFRREGVRRAAVMRDGVWVDLTLMALLENERVVPAVQRP